MIRKEYGHIMRRLVSLLMAVVLCVQYLPVAVTAEAASISDFGDGSDGALYIAAGQTVTLPVPVPHQSVVEMNYTSVYIEAGGVLQCSDYNAGLVIRSLGDVTVNGTIDQRGKAPKTNPNNTYPYPQELTCGSGGSGGAAALHTGGKGMPGRPYGGGYGGGGAGYTNDAKYGKGGDADSITIDIANIFIGGAAGTDNGRKSTGAGNGQYGGGGGGRGDHDRDSGNNCNGGAGGSGPGGNGGDGGYGGHDVTSGHGGGAGNTGGGIVLIYAKGKIIISGIVDCSGLNGGNSGINAPYYGGANGSGGGGGGGGAFYAEAGGATPTVSGTINVSGGAGGERGLSYGAIGNAGGYGSITVKRAADVSPPTILGVTLSTAWGLNTSAVINATDNVSGVASYAITTSSAVPGNGSWQSSNSFTLSTNGTYYAWAKDGLGNTTAGYSFTVSKIDNAAPVVTSATVTPTGWVGSGTKTITVTATDSQSGIDGYGITTANTAPTTWQAGNTFSKVAGTYYVWARDKVGNVSLSRSVTVDSIDTTAPVVTSATVTPTGWVGSGTKTITVTATDSQSGIAGYGITTSNAQPSTWQSGNTFSKAAGTYYLWAKDNVGNVSASRQVTVDNIDTVAPVVTSATVTPTGWTGDSTKTITVTASDSQSGIDGYGITTTTTAPTTWQTGNTFSKAAGTYYVWARDKVGNVSASRQVTVDNIDTTAPVVTSATVTPTGWVGNSTKTITVTATDSQSGIAGYGITTSNTQPSTWQSGNTFSKAAGTYYLWAKDKVGNVSASKQAVVDSIDTYIPVVSKVVLSENWSQSTVATIVATDIGIGIQDYAVTADNVQPVDGWQDSNSFTLSVNGTYYAWVRDKVGNVSLPFTFIVTKVDDVKPTVDSVTTSPGWGTDVTAEVEAADNESGIADYAVTADTVQPADGWQNGNGFTLSANGTYYAWVRDKVGNVSLPLAFTITKVDDVKPTVDSVTTSPGWGTNVTAEVEAADKESGIADYAVTADTVQPTNGWQDSNSFTLTANGTYYAWVRDKVGNVSMPFTFTVTKVDDVKPTVDSVTTSPGWGTDVAAEVEATDNESGIADYAVTADNVQPADGWQDSNSFTLTANGTYYAWVRDKVGNVSLPFTFTVTKVDDIKPTVDSVTTSPGWGTNVTAEVEAADKESGIADYAVTADTVQPADGWQDSNSFTLTANGTYYAWVRDKVGNVSLPFTFTVTKVDDVKPTVDSVTTSPGWGTNVTAEVEATDNESGIADYAVTANTVKPTNSWQESNSFTLTANGTYYAWVRDKVGNVSMPFTFTVTKVDDVKPTVDSVATSPGWGTSSVIGIGVSDLESGIQSYAVTITRTEPTDGWQDSNSFMLLQNGKYYAWTKDNANNVSVPFPFEVDKVDKLSPIIQSVTVREKRTLQQSRKSTFPLGLTSLEEVPDKWVKSVELIIQADDSPATTEDGCSGVVGYAVNTSGAVPTDGWQASASFTVDSNSIYYLWAVDVSGNVSVPKSYELNKIDDVPPHFGDGDTSDGTGGNSSVALPHKWVAVAGVVVKGSDNTGTQDFAVTETTAPPTHWQDAPLFELDANGSYYAWIKDRADNIIGPDAFEVTMVDNLPPGVSSVVINGSTAEIAAEDTQRNERSGCSGIIGYAITKVEADMPNGEGNMEVKSRRAVLVTDFDWQPINSIILTEGGIYEARTIDRAGNISEPLIFEYKPSSTGDDVWDKVIDDILNGRIPEDKIYSITMDGRVLIPRSLLEQLRGKEVILRIEHRERYVWAIDCRTIGMVPDGRLYYDLTVLENKEENRYIYQLPYSVPKVISFDVTHHDKEDLPFSAELSVRLHYSFADRYVYYRFKDAELIGGELPEEKLPKYLRRKKE